MGTVACHESHHMALVIASGNQHAGMRLQGHLGGIHFRLFRLPEGMILRQCKAGECLHGPVGRTGGVVPFRHQQTWVAVANGQHTIPGEDGLAEPLPHVAQQQMLHLSVADRFAFCFCQGLGCIESALGKAIGQASAVSQCFAGTVKPAGKVSRHLLATLNVYLTAFRVSAAHDFRIHQTIEVESPHGVIFPLIEIIEVPAVPFVVLFNHGKVFLHPLLIVRHAANDKAHVHQHPEEGPVVLRHVVVVDLIQPCMQLLLSLLRQVEKELLGCQCHAHAEHGHFHQPLVIVHHFAPVFRIFRVNAGNNALPPSLPQGLNACTVSCQHGHNSPQRTSKSLHLGNIIRVHSTRVPQMQPSFVGAKQGQQRFDQLNRRFFHIRPGTQRIMLHTISHKLNPPLVFERYAHASLPVRLSTSAAKEYRGSFSPCGHP